MTVKLMLIGDPHFKINSLSTLKVLKDEILKAADKHLPNGFVILGDTLDNHANVHSDVLNAAIDFIESLSRRGLVYVLIGNHDLCSNKCYLESRHAFNALKVFPNVFIIDSPQNFSYDGERFAAMPFIPNGLFQEAYSRFQDNEFSVLFAHQEFKGCSFNNQVSDSPDVWPLDRPLCVSGHIHSFQKIQQNLIYPGTPCQTSFGESDDKRISLLTIDEGKVSIKYIKLNVPKKITYETDIAGIPSLEFDGISSYRLKVKCDSSEWSSFRKSSTYKKLIEDGVKIVPETGSPLIVQNRLKVSYLENVRRKLEEANNQELDNLWKEVLAD